MPVPVDDIQRAGNGRYLVLLFRSVSKLGLFDIQEQKLSQFIQIKNSDSLVAASYDKVVLISPGKHEVRRYSLPGLKLELTEKLRIEGKVHRIALGASSAGPLLLVAEVKGKPQIQFLDLLKFHPLVKKTPRTYARLDRFLLRASADGRVFGISGNRTLTMVLNGDEVLTFSNPEIRLAMPSAQGKHVFTNRGLRTEQLEAVKQTGMWAAGPTSAATRERFYLSVYAPGSFSRGDKTIGRVSLHLSPLAQPLATFDDLRMVGSGSSFYSTKRPISLDQKLVFDPPSGTIVALTEAKNRLRVKKIDLPKLLKESKLKQFLVVTSQPSPTVSPGKSFSYQVTTFANQEPLKYSFDSAPKGMKISSQGLVKWDVPKAFKGTEHVILNVRDAKANVRFHTFQLTLPSSKPWQLAKAGRSSTKAGVQKVSRRVVKLPASIDDACYGRDGRLLAVRLASLRKLALVDLIKGKIERFIDLPSANCLFALGRDHLVIVDPILKRVSRYSLSTGKFEQQMSLPTAGQIHAVALGARSLGPALVVSGNDQSKVGLLDLQLLKLQPVSLVTKSSVPFDRNIQVRAAADGRTFAMWRVNSRPTGVGLMRITSTTAMMNYRHETAGYIALNANGSNIVTAIGRFNSELLPVGKKVNSFFNFDIPSSVGEFFVRVPRIDRAKRQTKKSVTVAIFKKGIAQPLVHVDNSGIRPAEYAKMSARGGLSLDRRVRLLPEAGLLVTLPETNNEIQLHQFDLPKALARVGGHYLFVHSLPVREATLGKEYQYQLRLTAAKTVLKYGVSSGPAGMKVSPTGKVTWKVPANEKQKMHTVILSVSDGKKEVFQTFTIDIPNLKAPVTVRNQPIRTWTDLTGTFQVQGKFLRRSGDDVFIKLANGNEVKIALKKLSNTDQRYIQKIK